MDDFIIYDYAKYDSGFTPPETAETADSILYLNFEEPSSGAYTDEPIYEAVSQNYATTHGNAQYEGKNDTYKFGNASLYFPGSINQGVQVSNTDLNFGTNDFTISFWVNPETQVGTRPFFFGGSPVGASSSLNFYIITGTYKNRPSLWLSTGTAITATTSDYKVGAWTHYAVVREEGIFYLYENGVLVGTDSSKLTSAVDLSNIVIGNQQDASSNGFKGHMDDFAIYNYAKYDSDFTPPTTDAARDPSNAPMDPLEITEQLSGNDFTIMGNANITGSDTEKMFGNASLHFPGAINQGIQITSAELDFGTKDFTISFWVNPEIQTGTRPFFFGSLPVSSSNSLNFYLMTATYGRRPSLWLGTGTRITATTSDYKAGVWTHYAVVRKNGVFNLYDNGILVGSDNTKLDASINLSDFVIGNKENTGSGYKGYLDDFSIYDYAVWNGDFTPPNVAGAP